MTTDLFLIFHHIHFIWILGSIFISELNLELIIDTKMARLSGCSLRLLISDELWLLFPI